MVDDTNINRIALDGFQTAPHLSTARRPWGLACSRGLHRGRELHNTGTLLHKVGEVGKLQIYGSTALLKDNEALLG